MMNLYQLIPRRLEQGYMGQNLKTLHDLYNKIELAQQTWIQAVPFRCPTGCGNCCESFEPDILEIEALFLAAHMIYLYGDDANGLIGATGRESCVLADPENPYHCRVYGGRPLICRLFAYCGDRDKEGHVRYRPCRHMHGAGIATLTEEDLNEKFGVLPPAMGDLAMEADLIMPEERGKRRILREALPEALAKLRYLLDLGAAENFSSVKKSRDDGDKDDGDGRDDSPFPAAS